MQIDCNIRYYTGVAYLDFGEYKHGGVSIRLSSPDGPIATATAWVEGLEPGEVAIKDYSENEGMLGTLLDAGVVMKPHRYIRSGFVNFPICRRVQ